jgi:hypothetical protein
LLAFGSNLRLEGIDAATHDLDRGSAALARLSRLDGVSCADLQSRFGEFHHVLSPMSELGSCQQAKSLNGIPIGNGSIARLLDNSFSTVTNGSTRLHLSRLRQRLRSSPLRVPWLKMQRLSLA